MKLKLSLLMLSVVGLPCSAQILDPLHGCIIGTTCTEDPTGKVTPTTTNPMPNFTFTVSPGPNSGDFLVNVLVPNNEDPIPSAVSFAITGTLGGPTNTTPVSGSSTLKGDWTSGDLAAFLSLPSSSPANPLSAWLSYTQGNHCGPSQNSACDAGATGYEVYQIDLGNNNLLKAGLGVEPILTLSGSPLPLASVLAGFLGNKSTLAASTSWIATAPSGGIFEAGSPTTSATSTTSTTSTTSASSTSSPVPEPDSIMLLGTGLLGAFTLLRKRFLVRS